MLIRVGYSGLVKSITLSSECLGHCRSDRGRVFSRSYGAKEGDEVNCKMGLPICGSGARTVTWNGRIRLDTLDEVERFTKDIASCPNEILDSIKLINLAGIKISTDNDVLVIGKLSLALMHQQKNLGNLTHLVFGVVQKNITLLNFASNIQSLFFVSVGCALHLKHLYGIVEIQIGALESGAKIEFPTTLEYCFISDVLGETVIEDLVHLKRITIKDAHANLTVQNLKNLNDITVISFFPSSKKFEIKNCHDLKSVCVERWHSELKATNDGVAFINNNKE